jgi:hypothetical protein
MKRTILALAVVAIVAAPVIAHATATDPAMRLGANFSTYSSSTPCVVGRHGHELDITCGEAGHLTLIYTYPPGVSGIGVVVDGSQPNQTMVTGSTVILSYGMSTRRDTVTVRSVTLTPTAP